MAHLVVASGTPTALKSVAYVTHGARLLVFRQPRSPEAGLQVPAGTVEPGESPAQAVVREAREETGLRGLRLGAHLGTRDLDMTPYGRPGLVRRHFYHLIAPAEVPEAWRHWESAPSEGPRGPIPFDFRWSPLTDLPPLAAELEACLGELAASIAAQQVRKEQMSMTERTEQATFGAGCFWGVEVAFRNVPGVLDAVVGYMGGTTDNPTYKEVCSGTTGHAEVVQVTYDPARVSFDELLDVFWSVHDPTQRNRQGPDVGSQYRSVIFTHSPAQRAAAERSRADLDSGGTLSRPVVTEVEEAATFTAAEEYHQRYLEKRGLATCAV